MLLLSGRFHGLTTTIVGQPPICQLSIILRGRVQFVCLALQYKTEKSTESKQQTTTKDTVTQSDAHGTVQYHPVALLIKR